LRSRKVLREQEITHRLAKLGLDIASSDAKVGSIDSVSATGGYLAKLLGPAEKDSAATQKVPGAMISDRGFDPKRTV